MLLFFFILSNYIHQNMATKWLPTKFGAAIVELNRTEGISMQHHKSRLLEGLVLGGSVPEGWEDDFFFQLCAWCCDCNTMCGCLILWMRQMLLFVMLSLSLCSTQNLVFSIFLWSTQMFLFYGKMWCTKTPNSDMNSKELFPCFRTQKKNLEGKNGKLVGVIFVLVMSDVHWAISLLFFIKTELCQFVYSSAAAPVIEYLEKGHHAFLVVVVVFMVIVVIVFIVIDQQDSSASSNSSQKPSET